jgi:hypothetical protein
MTGLRVHQRSNFLPRVLLDFKKLVELGPTKEFPDFGAEAAKYQPAFLMLQSPMEQDQLAQNFAAHESNIRAIHGERLAIRTVGYGVPLSHQLCYFFAIVGPVIQKAYSRNSPMADQLKMTILGHGDLSTIMMSFRLVDSLEILRGRS